MSNEMCVAGYIPRTLEDNTFARRPTVQHKRQIYNQSPASPGTISIQMGLMKSLLEMLGFCWRLGRVLKLIGCAVHVCLSRFMFQGWVARAVLGNVSKDPSAVIHTVSR